jgi:DNA polymerase-1
MIAHYLLEPELRHNMDYLSETYLKYKPVSITSLIGNKGKNQLSMRDVAVDKVAEYAAEDADITLQLRNYLEPWLKTENLYSLFSAVEAPLVKVLTEMEYNGVKVDTDYLNNYSAELAHSIVTLESQVYAAAGERFNISSPKQVGELLFDKLKLGAGKKTKTGQYSTDEDTLLELAEKHEVPKLILQYRGLTKLKSTYVDALPALVNPKTGRIHSSFNQALAATGRLSSQNPNLQNIPIRTPEGARVRKAFIPRDTDHILLSADYSQIELRLIAEIANEGAMLEAFSNNQDIHQATAARVFDVPYQEVTKEQRNRAKTVNFSIIYGAGAQNLSRQLNIPRAEASELIKQYFNRYEGLRQYMENTVKNARENGFVTTLIGRRRLLRNINSRNGLDRSNAERMAINTPIQGTAADMIKLAMIHIHEAMQERKMQSKLILQVHDELVFDVWKPELEAIKILVEDKMKNAIPDLKVPIEVGLGTGVNWLEAH